MARRWKPRLALRVSPALAVLAGLAVLFAWWSDQPRRQQRAIDLTQRLGGFVSHDDEHMPLRPQERHDANPALTWLQAQLGPEADRTLTRISLDGSALHDDDLVQVSRLAGLQRLYLNGTPVTSAGLAHLRGLPQLRVLELSETSVGDTGLAHLRDLKRVEVLKLDRTQVGDEGLAHLKGMTELR
ncbi:MAG TPA: hypothetical protein VGZ22_02910, partial [Isosphaeraceae bacterium]|nr:hypothetical protein [Isosphaeraceae bacterium]